MEVQSRRVRMRGTGRSGHATLRSLPDGRVAGTVRETGSNVVLTRVGEPLAVVTWMGTKIEEDNDEQ